VLYNFRKKLHYSHIKSKLNLLIKVAFGDFGRDDVKCYDEQQQQISSERQGAKSEHRTQEVSPSDYFGFSGRKTIRVAFSLQNIFLVGILQK
jgi:hypothetical protein